MPPSVERYRGCIAASVGVDSEEGTDYGVTGECLAAGVNGGRVDAHGVAYGALKIGGEAVRCDNIDEAEVRNIAIGIS